MTALTLLPAVDVQNGQAVQLTQGVAGSEKVFGDPLGVWGGAYAPLGRATREGDQWRLSGTWPWGSGSQNCTWMAGGAVCDDGVFRLLYVPIADVTIIENWDVVGLRGTGTIVRWAREHSVSI